MELHIETSGVLGDRLFINDKHGLTVAEVHLLVRDAAPFITRAVNTHSEMLKALGNIWCPECDRLLSVHTGDEFDCKPERAEIAAALTAIRKAQEE